MTKLLPCPFCGGENQYLCRPTCLEGDIYRPDDRAYPIVKCRGCGAEIPGDNWDHAGNSAIAAWNRRQPLENIEELAANPFGDEAVREMTSEISRRAKARRERMVSLEAENAALKARAAELEEEIKRRDEAKAADAFEKAGVK